MNSNDLKTIIRTYSKNLLLLALAMMYSCKYQIQTSEQEREKVYHQYKVPDLHLSSFSENDKDTIVDYLTKSSEWHVFPIFGTLLAMKRNKSNTCSPVQVPPESVYPFGIIPAIGGQYLDLYPSASQIRESESPTKTNAHENSQVTLVMEKPIEYPDSTALKEPSKVLLSYLKVKSKNKVFDIYSEDGSEDIRRPQTTKFLIDTGKELKNLTRFIGKKTVDSSILPAGSMITSSQQIFLVQKPPDGFPGEYNVSGYLNPGQKGFIYIQIIDVHNGKMLTTSQALESTNTEYVGWSSNPTEKFNFCLRINIRGQDFNTGKSGVRFQLWFKPSNNSSNRMLAEQKLSVVDVQLK